MNIIQSIAVTLGLLVTAPLALAGTLTIKIKNDYGKDIYAFAGTTLEIAGVAKTIKIAKGKTATIIEDVNKVSVPEFPVSVSSNKLSEKAGTNVGLVSTAFFIDKKELLEQNTGDQNLTITLPVDASKKSVIKITNHPHISCPKTMNDKVCTKKRPSSFSR